MAKHTLKILRCSLCMKGLNISRECESMSSENVSIADSPDSASTILKNLRLANVNRLIYAQSKIKSIRNS